MERVILLLNRDVKAQDQDVGTKNLKREANINKIKTEKKSHTLQTSRLVDFFLFNVSFILGLW